MNCRRDAAESSNKGNREVSMGAGLELYVSSFIAFLKAYITPFLIDNASHYVDDWNVQKKVVWHVPNDHFRHFGPPS